MLKAIKALITGTEVQKRQNEAERVVFQKAEGRCERVYIGSRRDERCIHLFAAGSVVPTSPLPAYLLPGKLFVVVSLDPDTDHT